MAIIKTTSAGVSALDTSKLTSGTVATARLGSGTASSGTALFGDQTYKAISSYDDNKLVNDISTLALHQATNNNSAKYNLTNSNVDVYQDSSAIANLVNCARDSNEYISTLYTAVGPFINDSNTIMLLHMDNNVTDSSSNGITVTNNNNATFDSSTKKIGTHSIFLNGSTQYLSTPDIETVDNSVTAPSTGNYTFEGWFKFYEAVPNADRFYAIGNNGTPSSGSTPMLSIGYNASTQINYWGSVGSVNHNFAAPAMDTNWHHYATMRTSGTTYTYIDGVQRDSTGNFDDSTFLHNGTIFIGARSGSAGELVYGHVDEIRYSNIARYTTGSNGNSQFTPNLVTANNATGSYESTAQTANASVTKISAVVTYTNASGTNTLNTDIVLQVSANNGSNWSNATLTAAGTFSSGVLQAVTNDISVTAGTQLKYKISFANQASGSKVARINGVSLSY